MNSNKTLMRILAGLCLLASAPCLSRAGTRKETPKDKVRAKMQLANMYGGEAPPAPAPDVQGRPVAPAAAGKWVPLGDAASPVSVPVTAAEWDALMSKLMAAKPLTSRTMIVFVPKDVDPRIVSMVVPDRIETFRLVGPNRSNFYYCGSNVIRCPSGLSPRYTLETKIDYFKAPNVKPRPSNDVTLDLACVDASGNKVTGSLSVHMSREKATIRHAEVNSDFIYTFLQAPIVGYQANGKIDEKSVEAFTFTVEKSLTCF